MATIFLKNFLWCAIYFTSFCLWVCNINIILQGDLEKYSVHFTGKKKRWSSEGKCHIASKSGRTWGQWQIQLCWLRVQYSFYNLIGKGLQRGSLPGIFLLANHVFKSLKLTVLFIGTGPNTPRCISYPWHIHFYDPPGPLVGMLPQEHIFIHYLFNPTVF